MKKSDEQKGMKAEMMEGEIKGKEVRRGGTRMEEKCERREGK